MAREPMSEQEIQRLAHELAHISPYHVQEFYNEKLAACRLQPGTKRPPDARTIQELVTAWKLLRKYQR